MCDGDALDNVIQGGLTDLRVWISQRTMLVNLILENVGIYRSGAYAVLLREAAGFLDAARPIGEVPQHVQRYGGANARQAMNLSGIAQFFLRRGGGRELKKLPEARAGIRKSPRG